VLPGVGWTRVRQRPNFGDPWRTRRPIHGQLPDRAVRGCAPGGGALAGAWVGRTHGSAAGAIASRCGRTRAFVHLTLLGSSVGRAGSGSITPPPDGVQGKGVCKTGWRLRRCVAYSDVRRETAAETQELPGIKSSWNAEEGIPQGLKPLLFSALQMPGLKPGPTPEAKARTWG
jgi:hypothetical protein